MATSISINTTDTEYGTKKQKSVSYIDPNASNTELIAFAQGMVSLMADTSYESTTRIERTECDTIQPRTCTVTYRIIESASLTPIPNDGIITVTTSANLKTITVAAETSFDVPLQVLNFTDSNTDSPIKVVQLDWGMPGGWTAYVGKWVIEIATAVSSRAQITPRTVTFTLHFNGTNQYDAWDKEVTINVEAGE